MDRGLRLPHNRSRKLGGVRNEYAGFEGKNLGRNRWALLMLENGSMRGVNSLMV